jgi:hypothetical protein
VFVTPTGNGPQRTDVEARMEVRVMGSVEVRMEARTEDKVWGSRVKFRVLLHRPTRLRWVWVSWGCL